MFTPEWYTTKCRRLVPSKDHYDVGLAPKIGINFANFRAGDFKWKLHRNRNLHNPISQVWPPYNVWPLVSSLDPYVTKYKGSNRINTDNRC